MSSSSVAFTFNHHNKLGLMLSLLSYLLMRPHCLINYLALVKLVSHLDVFLYRLASIKCPDKRFCLIWGGGMCPKSMTVYILEIFQTR